jgi:hypothetical protein
MNCLLHSGKGDLAFLPMDSFLSYVLRVLYEDKARALRLFSLKSGVLGMFAERVSILFVLSSSFVLDPALGGR